MTFTNCNYSFFEHKRPKIHCAGSFEQWKTMTYDRHKLQNGIHLMPFRLPRELNVVRKYNQHHEDKVYRQQYSIAKINTGYDDDDFDSVLAEMSKSKDK